MKKAVISITLLISIAWISAAQAGNVFTEPVKTSARQLEASLEKGSRVVVVDFKSNSENLSTYLMDALMGQFVANKKITVVDQAHRDIIVNTVNLATIKDSVLREFNAELAGKTEDLQRAGVGKLLGAQYIVSGSCRLIGKSYELQFFAIDVESGRRCAQPPKISIDQNNAQALIENINRGAVPMPVVTFSPDSADTDFFKAQNNFSLGRFDLAVEQFTAVIRKNKDYIFAYRGRGFAYGYLQRYEEALNDFDKVVAMYEKYEIPDILAYYQRGMVHYYIGYQRDEKASYNKAINDFLHAVELIGDPNNPLLYDPLLAVGITYISLPDYEKAETAFNTAIKINKEFPVAYINLGWLYSKQRKYVQAESSFKKANELQNNRDSAAFFGLGRIYLEQNKYDLAEQSFAKTVQFSEKNVLFKYQGLVGLGELYLKKGDTKKSLEQLNNAISIDFEKINPHAYMLRGAVYLKNGDTSSAKKDFEQLKRIEPKYPVTDLKDAYNWYAAYIKTADIEKTLRSVESAPFSITGMDFANTDSSLNVIGSYSTSFQASAAKYISPRITYDNTGSFSGTKTLYIKIIKPDGSLERGDSSPSGYTYSCSLHINSGKKGERVLLSGWGSSSGGSYSGGTYTCEIWSEGKRLASSMFTMSAPREYVCPNCKGLRGSYCPLCGGSGLQWTIWGMVKCSGYYNAPGYGISYCNGGWIECPVCRGSGKLRSN